MKRKKLFTIFRAALGWLLTIFVLAPLLLVVVNSLKNEAESALMDLNLPSVFQWHNYLDVINEAHIIRSFFNSLFISTFAVIFGITASAMAAFVISRNRNRINRFLYYFFFIGLLAPLNYITLLKTMQVLKIINTYQGIILLNAALAIPFAVFLYYGFISTVPRDIDESAVMDGCNTLHLFFRVVLPLLKPVTITASVLTFIGAWNDFITPLYVLNNSGRWGMIITVYNFWGFYSRQWNYICAVITLTLIPILLIYIFAQNYIITGMTAGAIKG